MKRIIVFFAVILILVLSGGRIAVATGHCDIEALVGDSIQAAIDVAAPGDTICVGPGTFAANLTVDKQLSIIGSGSGPGGTVIQKATNAALVELTASGLSESAPLLLQDLRLTPSGNYGVEVNTASVAFVKLDNVHVVGTAPSNDTEAEVGLKVGTAGTLTDLVITNSRFEDLHYGFYFAKHGSWTSGSTVERVVVSNSVFHHNAAKGMYIEKLSEAIFSDLTVTDNGWNNGFFNAVWNAGIDINLKGDDNSYQNLVFNNLTVTGNALGAANGVGLTVKARDDGPTYGVHPASLDYVEVSGGVYAGNEAGIRFGEPGKNNASPTSVSVSNACIFGNGQFGLANESQELTVATSNWWGDASGPSGIGPGSGDAVTSTVPANVDYDPWLTAPAAACAPPDEEGPITRDVTAIPNPVATGASGTVTANVDDSTTGGSSVASAEFTLDDSPSWQPMNADDGVLDAESEAVIAGFTAPIEAGIYELCIRGTDAPGNLGAEECTMLVVYDPDGGFVTGGGWIDSPAGAYLLDGPVSISGDTASIDYLGYTGYMYRNLSAICDPNNSPVTLTGTLDVTNLQDNGADLFGVVDKEWIDAGNLGYQEGAYLYVARRGDNLVVGPTDGNEGGELVQTFATFVDYFADGSPDPLAVAAEIFGGTVTVTVGGNDYVDDYGTVFSSGGWAEFEHGAYIAIDSWPASNNVVYDLTVEGCSAAPSGKANFGFVSKYKKGANVPTGNTQFVFKAGDLNFHSTEYEWLVVTGSNGAKFKGSGTINGQVAPTAEAYKFQIWAGDGSPDTFRIKIWYEDDGEVVVYDNEMDQAIGGGNIVIHSK